MCIGRAIDENVQTSKVTKTSQVWNENVPDSDQQVPKCPTFRLDLVKCKDENVPDSNRQGRKRPRFRSARYENVPSSNQLGRKRPRFQSATTKTSQIPISKDKNVPDSDKIFGFKMQSSAIFRKICEKMRLGQKYAELCGEWRIMRNCAENRKLCDIALTALKCCLWKVSLYTTPYNQFHAFSQSSAID